VTALADFGDGQWAQALAAVLVGLMLAGGAVERIGPVAIQGPLAPVWELAGRAGCMLLGAPPAGAAVIMPPRQGGSR
jgi:hypothetical protein